MLVDRLIQSLTDHTGARPRPRSEPEGLMLVPHSVPFASRRHRAWDARIIKTF